MPINIQMKVAERKFSQVLINFNRVSALKKSRLWPFEWNFKFHQMLRKLKVESCLLLLLLLLSVKVLVSLESIACTLTSKNR